MAKLRLELYQKTASPALMITNPSEYKSYKEALSFDGCYAFASATDLTVWKNDGTIFRTPISHYESDFITETYLGHFESGKAFRFLFASDSNPMAQIDPMVTFASASTSGWAVHYRVRP